MTVRHQTDQRLRDIALRLLRQSSQQPPFSLCMIAHRGLDEVPPPFGQLDNYTAPVGTISLATDMTGLF